MLLKPTENAISDIFLFSRLEISFDASAKRNLFR